MGKIESKQQLEEMVGKDAFLLMKHSLTCPISTAAFDEFQKFIADHEELAAAYIAIQENRDLSAEVAQTYHVKHESPQVILFKKGDVAWHASHWNITYNSLTKALAE